MDTVPSIFCKNVIALLAIQATVPLFKIEHTVWATLAREMAKRGERFLVNQYVYYDDQRAVLDNFFYKGCSLINLDKIKHTRCSFRYVGKVSELFADNFSQEDLDSMWRSRQDIAKAFSVKWVEVLLMKDVRHFDNHFANFWPYYVCKLQVELCYFNTDSEFPTWLKRMLQTNHLESVEIRSNFLDTDMLNIEEDIYNAVVRDDGSLSEVKMFNNFNIYNVTMTLLQKILDFWRSSDEGFGRKIFFGVDPTDSVAYRRALFNGHNDLFHESGCGHYARLHLTSSPFEPEKRSFAPVRLRLETMSVASQMNGVQEFKRNEVHTDVARSSPTQGPIVRESQRDDTDGLGTASAATTLGVQTYTLTKIIAAISAIISFFCLAEAFVLWSLPVPYFFSITANVTVIVSALLFFFGFRKGIPLPVKFFFWGCGFQSIARLLVAGWLGIVAILGVGNSAKLMQMANVTGGVINGLLQIFMSIAIVNVVLSVAFAFFTWIAFRFNKQFQMYGVNR